MKRVLHYLLLALLLLGVPYVCCLVGGYDDVLEGVRQFPPRTEDWGFHPEKLWNVRRPFNWWWFLGMCLFTFVCMFPLVMRGIRALRTQPFRTESVKRRLPWFGWLGLVILFSAWVLAWSRFSWFAPFQPHTYFPLWFGLILILNAWTLKRSGHSPLTDHPWIYALTFPASSLFWWFFEYLNRYVWNWYYLGVSEMSATEYTLYATLCFSTVLPGVMAMAEFLGTFRFFTDRHYDGMTWRPDIRSVSARLCLLVLALVGLTGIVYFPDCAYPLLWISPLMVFILLQTILKEPSVLDQLAQGAWGLVFRYEVAALACGLCWETWNYWSYAKWVYAVPWVHAFQIWEMPLIGFAGYLPFGVECAAVTAWLYSAFGHKEFVTTFGRRSKLMLSIAFGLMITCAVAAEEPCTNTVPSITWSSVSGVGPFKEIQSESYESAGWLKWLFEAHMLRCDVRIEKGEPYVLGIEIPCNMQLTHVSYHPEWANRITKDDHEFGWCKVSRESGWAEITVPGCRRMMSLRLAFHEKGWPFFCSDDEGKSRFIVCDPAASQYDHEQKIYKELSDKPCATPLSAARAAERIFVGIYGNEVVSERPWRVTEINGCYLVTGSLPKGMLGGVAQLKLQKNTGRVWVYLHGK